MNKNLRRVVKEVLKENEKSLKENGKKFEFAIRGVDYMNDDPTMVRILYGKVIRSFYCLVIVTKLIPERCSTQCTEYS